MKMKHYRWKRFCCRLFLRRSPRNAAVFGFGWLLLAETLPAGIFFFAALPLFGSIPWEWLLVNGAAVGLTVWGYGAAVFGYACSGMARRCFRKVGWYREGAGVMGIFYRLGMLVAAPCLFRQERRAAALFCAVGGVLLSFFYFALLGMLPVNSCPVWYATLAGSLLFTGSLICFRDGRRFRPTALLPLLIFFLYVGGLHFQEVRLDREIREAWAEISSLAGYPADVESFRRREAEGIPLSDPVLDGLIRTSPQQELARLHQAAPEVRTGELERFRRTHPDYLRALAAFLELEPQRVRHVREGDLLASVRIPELNAFRDAARYLCVEMAAAGTEREKVLKCNDDLLRIRAWCRKDAFLLAKLVGMAVESMRLEALCFPLAAGTLTDDDLIRLPGQGEEWSSALAEAVADEATGFLDCCTYVRSAAEPGQVSKQFRFPLLLRRCFPLEYSIWVRRDFLFGLKFLGRQLNLYRSMPSFTTGNGRYQMACFDDAEALRNKYLLSGMLLPGLDGIHRKQAWIENHKLLTDTAFAIERFRRKYGTLPETLETLVPEFLESPPLSRMDALPVRYERDESFYTLTAFGPPGKNAETFSVRLSVSVGDGIN